MVTSETRFVLSGFETRAFRDKRLKAHLGRLAHDDEHVIFDEEVARALNLEREDVPAAPRSVYRVGQLYEALQLYAPQFSSTPQASTHFDVGFSSAYAAFARPQGVERLKPLPLTPDSVQKLTSNPEASAGVTWFGKEKGEVADLALDVAIRTAEGKKVPEPCVSGARTQRGDKTRLVWMYPYSMTILEGLFAQPLVQSYLNACTPMAFGERPAITGARILEATRRHPWTYSLDMSKFDGHVSRQLIYQAFRIMATWFDLDAVEPTTGLTYQTIWEVVERYFIFTPIIMPDTLLYLGKDHGVPSGSYFTNMVDSIVNVMVCAAVFDELQVSTDIRSFLVMGDDILVFADQKVSLDEIARVADERYGIVVHGSEKSEVLRRDRPVPFLGRHWAFGMPHRPVVEILQGMLYPERPRKWSDDPVERDHQIDAMLLAYLEVAVEAWKVVELAHPKLLTSQWQDPFSLGLKNIAVRKPSDLRYAPGSVRFNALYGGGGSDPLLPTDRVW